MSQQRVTAGGTLDIPSLDEIANLMLGGPLRQRVVAKQVIQLNNVGNGSTGVDTEDLYTVPAGMFFEARRISFNLNTATDPNTGNVALNVTGKYISLLRSGEWMEYANPSSAAGVPSIPGAQSWAKEQGPYLQNQQVFQVACVGLTANASVTVILEGVQTDPNPHREGRKR